MQTNQFTNLHIENRYYSDDSMNALTPLEDLVGNKDLPNWEKKVLQSAGKLTVTVSFDFQCRYSSSDPENTLFDDIQVFKVFPKT